MQTAILPSQPVHNGKNYGGDKEMIAALSCIAYYKGEILEPVILRLYIGRSRSAHTVYAAIWCNERNAKTGEYVSACGHGKAGGYGYCKQSAAADDAIRNAGIALSESISGVGQRAVEDAMRAIARAMGYRKLAIVRH